MSSPLPSVHCTKSSLIKDRIPSRAQRTILPPHCHPFLFDGNLRSGVIYLFIFFVSLLLWLERKWCRNSEPYNVAKPFIFKQKFAPGKQECLWIHSMKFYCVQEAKCVSVNLKTLAFATMLLILATPKALFYKALFSCILPHKFQQVQRRRPRLVQHPMQILLLIRKNCCSVYTAIVARIKIWSYFLLPRGSGNKIHAFFGGGSGGYTTQFFMHTSVGTNLRDNLQEK